MTDTAFEIVFACINVVFLAAVTLAVSVFAVECGITLARAVLRL